MREPNYGVLHTKRWQLHCGTTKLKMSMDSRVGHDGLCDAGTVELLRRSAAIAQCAGYYCLLALCLAMSPVSACTKVH